MKKYFGLFFVLAIVFTLGFTKANAHEDGTKHAHDDDDRKEFKEGRKEANDDWKEQRAQMRAKRADMMRDMKDKREAWKEDMRLKWNNDSMIVRGQVLMALLTRTENMTQIAGRIEARIDKLEDANIDTGSAQTHVNNAENELADAKQEIEELKDAIEADKNIEDLKTILKSIKEDLKNAHTSLRSAVEEIKKNVVKEL